MQRTLILVTAVAAAALGAPPVRAQEAPVETPSEPSTTPTPTPPEPPTPAANTPVSTTPAPAAAAPSAAASPAAAGATEPLAAPKPKPPKPKKGADTAPAKPLLGLAIGTPDYGAPPGKFKPAYGVPPRSAADWKFDFHGYLNMPLRFGIGERPHPLDTQYKTVFHGPPLAADEKERFEHTGLIPQPWVQLGFSYGNSDVAATIIIAAASATNATAFFDPPAQVGINDAFVTFKPHFHKFDLAFDVGAFQTRHGAMGEYDTGRYDTPVIAAVSGVGYDAHAAIPIGNSLVFLAEDGTAGQFDRAPLGVAPAG
jgi:hypothetical protein